MVIVTELDLHIFMVSIMADLGFPRGGTNSREGAPTYYSTKKLSKTAWKWLKLDPVGVRPLPPLDPPLVNMIVTLVTFYCVNKSWRCRSRWLSMWTNLKYYTMYIPQYKNCHCASMYFILIWECTEHNNFLHKSNIRCDECVQRTAFSFFPNMLYFVSPVPSKDYSIILGFPAFEFHVRIV